MGGRLTPYSGFRTQEPTIIRQRAVYLRKSITMHTGLLQLCSAVSLLLLFACSDKDNNIITPQPPDASRVNLMDLKPGQETMFIGYQQTCDSANFSWTGDTLVMTILEENGELFAGENYSPGSTSVTAQNEKINYVWFSAKFKNIGYIPLGSAFSLGYLIQAEATFKPLLSNYFSTILEATAFQPNVVTKSLFMEHYRANQFLALGLMPVYNFRQQVHAKLEAYAYVPVQEILRGQDNQAYLGNYFKSMRTLFNASLNVVTVAGPATLHVGYITDEENPWLVQLSFGYLLFNKKSVDE